MAILFRTGVEFLGYAGALFVVYGTYAAIWGPPWPPLEKVALPTSSFFTVFGAGLTAVSVYLHGLKATVPENKSLYVTAPIVIAAALAAIIVLLVRGALPPVTVNGFAMLAIAGALFRLQPRPPKE